MNTFEAKEEQISQKLRQSCDSRGCEIYLEMTGQALNEMGLLYKTKSPDKISLIQSAALLNAAIVRQPSNKKFQEDLEDLCNHVLECAGASRKINLIKISKRVKKKVTEMRKESNKKRKNIKPIRKGKSVTQAVIEFQCSKRNLSWMNRTEKETLKINSIKALQNEIARRYKNIMVFISLCSIVIMGETPCKFAIVGMGSLARKEITPYSDFEHIIILEDLIPKQNRENILEYFRWFSVIFQIIVINLQETIIPSVWIPSLNNNTKPNGNWFFDKVTTRGISFDGMMPHACKFPLGRFVKTKAKPWKTELIKPVSEMVKYLDAEEDLKNGYHLADILTKTCLVFGDEDVFKMFSKKVNESQQKQLEKVLQQAIQQLIGDLQNFNICRHLKTYEAKESFNIKRVIYRSITLFITALGQFNNCMNKNVNFLILEELYQRNIINDKAFHDLSFAVAFACHLRLHQYMRMQGQCDTVDEYLKNLIHLKDFNSFASVASKSEFVKFFETVLRLQIMLAEGQLKNMNKYFSKNKILPRLAAKVILGEMDEVACEGERYLRSLDNLDENDEDNPCVVKYVISAYKATGNLVKASNIFNEFGQSVIKDKKQKRFGFCHSTFFLPLIVNFLLKEIKETEDNEKPEDSEKPEYNEKTEDSEKTEDTEKFDTFGQLFEVDKMKQIPLLCIHYDYHKCLLAADIFLQSELYHEALGLLRKYFRISNSSFDLFNNQIDARYNLSAYLYVCICLIQISRCEQALHKVFEILQLLDLHGTGWQYLFYNLIIKCYSELGYTKQMVRYRDIIEICLIHSTDQKTQDNYLNRVGLDTPFLVTGFESSFLL